MKTCLLALAAVSMSLAGCARPTHKHIDVVLPIAPGGDAIEPFTEPPDTGFRYHYAFSGATPDELVRFHDSVFARMGLLVYEPGYYGTRFKRKAIKGRSELWFSKSWVTPDSQTVVTFFARERDSSGHLFTVISKSALLRTPDSPQAPAIDHSGCLAQWDKGDTLSLTPECSRYLQDSLRTILEWRYFDARDAAWMDDNPRKASLIIDILATNVQDYRSVIRWADDKSMSSYSPHARPAHPKREIEASRWADSLEHLLGRRQGSMVPAAQRHGISGSEGVIVFVPKNASWERFEDLRTSVDNLNRCDSITRIFMLEHPAELRSYVDSAGEAASRLLQAMGEENMDHLQAPRR